MKIALINPPLPRPFAIILKLVHYREIYSIPLGLAYIAAYARQAGHTVKIFDPEPCGMPLELMWRKIEEFRPDIVGITSVTPNFMLARQLVIEAKRCFGCLVVMGGPHVNALPRSTLQGLPELDAVILGEGEIPILDLATEFDARGKVDFNKIPGAAFMEGWNYKETPRPELISNLDALPYPARDLVDINLYTRRYPFLGKKRMVLLSSRGCPSQCTFCANICMGRKFRARSAADVVGEMEYLVEKYGIRHFQFADDCFTAAPERVSEICELIISKQLDVTWDIMGRVNTLLDEALILKMKRAGCVQIMMGIETGNQRILDLMKKGTTIAMIEECCSLLRKYSIATYNSYIIGGEGDTKETIMSTIAFSKKLKSEMAVFAILVPLPGTPLFDKYYKDYDTPDTNWSAWYSAMRAKPYEYRHTALSNKTIWWFMIWAHLRFYLDPFQFLRLLFHVIDIG